MSNDGRIGPNSLDTSGSCRSRTMNAGRRVGIYGTGTKVMLGPKILKSACPRRGNARMMAVLLVFAVVVVIASAVALPLSAKEKASAPDVPADARAQKAPGSDGVPGTLMPGQPLLVFGYVYDKDGNVVDGASLTCTDERLGPSVALTTSSGGYTDPDTGLWVPLPGTGYYQFQLADWDPGYMVDDTIDVTVLWGTQIGSFSFVVIEDMGGFVSQDIHMLEIPEFSMVLVPVVGMMALVAAVSMWRRAESK